MARQRTSLAATLAVLACLGGCAIADMRADNAAARGRIEVKTQTLADEQNTQAGLASQRDQLMADLRSRELTLAQLSARLDALAKANEAAAAATPAQQQRQQANARKLADIRKQAQALNQSPDLPAAEKARRADALKEQTRKMLEVLLVD